MHEMHEAISNIVRCMQHQRQCKVDIRTEAEVGQPPPDEPQPAPERVAPENNQVPEKLYWAEMKGSNFTRIINIR